METYQIKNRRKLYVPLNIFSIDFPIRDSKKGSMPDLFCYRPDYQDYFVCQIKCLADRYAANKNNNLIVCKP